ncbi:MAG TPA: SsrA-binding protein [Flavobacteriales bacterium]|nr:SsrA-binding protein [Flavobacteriales bacterium]
MKKQLFRLLARLNKLIFPKMWDKNLLRLTKTQKLIVGWRYYVTRNAL